MKKLNHGWSTAVSILTVLVMLVTTFYIVTAPKASSASNEILFIGDSMTSLYNDTPGDPNQGWWSMVAADQGKDPVLSAEYGSGYLRRGNTTNVGVACSGTSLVTRIGKLFETKPSVVVVAAGRNDLKKCVNGTAVAATTTESMKAVNTYYAALLQEAQAAGIPADKVYVLVPWGNLDTTEAGVLRPKIRDAARSYGFTWITTNTLSASQTVDGLHQNAAGNLQLANQVIAGMS